MNRKAAALLLASALIGCSSQQAAQTQRQVSAQAGKSVSAMNNALKKVNVNDATLKVRVSAAIAEQTGANAFRISPDVHDGVVTLNGTVPNSLIQATVLKTVTGLSGVKRVVNRLRVQS